MSSNDFVIRVRDLSKRYEMYAHPRDRLKQFMLPRIQKLVGKAPSQYFEEFKSLSEVSFDIKRGETVGIIGRNGSGKSTLLQLICGTLTPTSGSVQTNGRIAALLELGSGFNPEFTGRENIYLNAAVLGLSNSEVDKRFEAIAAFADIGSFMDHPIKTYSSGMAVRLAFATAIHVEPDILVVDEALAVGDTAFQQKCLNRIRQMQQEGVSILLVTHSSNTLIEYCDRGIFLKHGELVLDGPCRDVVKAYADDLVQDEGGTVFTPKDSATINDVTSEKWPEGDSSIPLNVMKEPLTDSKTTIQSVRILNEDGKETTNFTHGNVLRVEVTINVHRDNAHPCFGIQLLSTDGIGLWSATTQNMNVSLPALPQGVHKFCWRLTANFSGNRYIISLGVGDITSGEYKRHHRLEYAGHFDVLPQPAWGAGWLAPQPSVDELVINSMSLALKKEA
ncbi:ABC transporter ATP-binding protein [Pseudomonas sp. LAM2023]|uniref:ABC transporter ATP-binding protein n=1 Tax=Pseudomonas sp. LAM2023 TaxID=2800477 RepID=UPI00190DB33E|nr:ABC transporter ATP-binding protein [Pseudomonas sp. LAM2023]